MNSVFPEGSSIHDAADQSVYLAKSVVADVIDGEAIVVDLNTGAYYSATGFAAVFVETLVGSHSVNTIVDQICLRLGASRQDVLPAVHHLCRQLMSFDILTSPSDGFSEDSFSLEGTPFDGMTISRHTDMKQLLELDPVHQVDESGWPNAADAR